MFQVQDLSYTFNKDNIVNYERKLIQSPFESLPKPMARHESKYSVCEINSKVQELVNDAPYNLRWIGNSPHSSISAYIYCLLMLSIASTKNLMLFKSAFYELCRKYLDVKEQKLLIQFLCLLQYSSDKYLFLKKYPIVDSIIFSVFEKLQAEEIYYHEQQTDSTGQFTDSSRFSHEAKVSRKVNFQMEDSTTGQLFQMNKLAELYSKFSLKFNFLKWTKSSESSFVLTIDESTKMYIIVEREYFFALQILEKTQIKTVKSKLSKGDRIQVERLLNYSQTDSQINFQQKLNNLPQNGQKNILKIKKDPFNTNHTVDSDSGWKDILVCNIKGYTAAEVSVSPKKEFKFSYFTKKINSKVEEIHQSIINQKQGPKRQLEYIDLMESSFEQERVNEGDRMRLNKQAQESHPPKFYTPKFLAKPLHSPIETKKKKKSFDEKTDKTQAFAKRGRSPSQAEKKYATFVNGEKDSKSHKSKQIKFYSPPRHFGESPEKKNANKVENQAKKAHDFHSKEKPKENFRHFDKKYNDKKESIKKDHAQNDRQKTQNANLNKIKMSFSYNPKIYNNRISLQSRKDLDLLAKYKLPTQDLMLNKIPEADQSEEASRRQFFQKKKMIREELGQSLNNKSEVLLKKRLFEHLGTKFAGENLSFIQKSDEKLNRSFESKQKNHTSQVNILMTRNQQVGKEKRWENQKQCPQNCSQSMVNGGFDIRIRYADVEQIMRSQ